MKSEAEHGHRVRRRKFIDASLQRRLLVGLVVLELLMLLVGISYLYFAFAAHIEANLFTIHRSAQSSLLNEFLREMGLVVLVMGSINTLALFIAHRLWLRHIRAVVRAFRERLERVARLDLTPIPEPRSAHHEVLDLLEAWRRQECIRVERVDLLLSQLSHPQADPNALPALFHELDNCLQSVR